MTRTKALRLIDEIYATLPKLECRGLCTHSCTVIHITPLEWNRIVARIGDEPVMDYTLDDLEHYTKTGEDRRGNLVCPLLRGGRCSVYDIRPAICRLWGCFKPLACKFGCTPERWLSETEFANIQRRVNWLGKATYLSDLARHRVGARLSF